MATQKEARSDKLDGYRHQDISELARASDNSDVPWWQSLKLTTISRLVRSYVLRIKHWHVPHSKIFIVSFISNCNQNNKHSISTSLFTPPSSFLLRPNPLCQHIYIQDFSIQGIGVYVQRGHSHQSNSPLGGVFLFFLRFIVGYLSLKSNRSSISCGGMWRSTRNSQ